MLAKVEKCDSYKTPIDYLLFVLNAALFQRYRNISLKF